MADRKKDHINLAFEAQTKKDKNDKRFYYEPLLSKHPTTLKPLPFLGKKLNAPIWISSMTGGTALARKINRNLAQAAAEFGLGMGLGSCRCLLEKGTCFDDFNVRPIIGNDLPLYANLGIAQIEQLVASKKTVLAKNMVDKLKADGLIIHINPLQEFFQQGGDRFAVPPIETIHQFLEITKLQIIVKEVGQGMGRESLQELLKLPLEAIDFGAFGGTNFSKLELLRNKAVIVDELSPLKNVGHTAEEMLEMVNNLIETGKGINAKQLIISGGIGSFLDGYHLINKSKLPAIYGQGSVFLKHAMQEYGRLRKFIETQIKGLEMAYAYLRVK